MFEKIASLWIRSNATKALRYICLHLWGMEKGTKILAALLNAGALDQIEALGASILAKLPK
jgi:hypothetical protein